MTATVRLSLAEAKTVCREAALRAGASPDAAAALAISAVAAEAEENRAVGLAHFMFYLDALAAGRIDGAAEPQIVSPLPAIVHSDARGGTAHLGFDRAFPRLVAAARTLGCAVFSQKNAYTCGALGYFAARLASEGLVAIAATNGPALVAVPGGRRPVYCTNPMALAAPMADGEPLLVDQSSSSTAFVKVLEAAERGLPIPQGWAIDADGRPTTDAAAAVRGALLPFAGARGANVALMVEVLAAGLSGASWSLDAPSISEGSETPGTGLFVAVIEPAAFGPDFAERLAAHAARLEAEGVHIPGRAKAAARRRAEAEGVEVPAELLARISGFAR